MTLDHNINNDEEQQQCLEEYEDKKIPIIFRNTKYYIPFSCLEENEGKNNVLSYLKGEKYNKWKICTHYQRQKNDNNNEDGDNQCSYGVDCWKLHINHDVWKKEINSHYEKENNNNNKRQYHRYNNNDNNSGNFKKENQQEYHRHERQINKELKTFPVALFDKIQQIPIEATNPTKRAILVKKQYEESAATTNGGNRPMVSEYCAFYAQEGTCKYGRYCNYIHIEPWFINHLKKEMKR